MSQRSNTDDTQTMLPASASESDGLSTTQKVIYELSRGIGVMEVAARNNLTIADVHDIRRSMMSELFIAETAEWTWLTGQVAIHLKQRLAEAIKSAQAPPGARGKRKEIGLGTLAGLLRVAIAARDSAVRCAVQVQAIGVPERERFREVTAVEVEAFRRKLVDSPTVETERLRDMARMGNDGVQQLLREYHVKWE